MSGSSGPARIADLHKSAFWIYGITAMVMREPVAMVVRHAASAGVTDPDVRAELLRTIVVLGMMSRLFLAAGLYFDEVYLRPDSASRFVRRSYPIDFMAGMLHFLLAMGASTVIAGAPAAYAAAVAIYFLFEPLRWAAARTMQYSAAALLAGPALTATLSCVLWLAAYKWAPATVAYLLLMALTAWEIAKLVRQYNTQQA